MNGKGACEHIYCDSHAPFLFFYVSQVEHSYEHEIFENGFIFAGAGTFN